MKNVRLLYNLQMRLMEDEKLEFFKLEMLDRKVIFWMMDHAPDAIRSWLDHLEIDYNRKGRTIDRLKLLNEIVIGATYSAKI